MYIEIYPDKKEKEEKRERKNISDKYITRTDFFCLRVMRVQYSWIFNPQFGSFIK